MPLRVSRALVETDLIVTVTAAETVLHGGPAALLKACGREALRGMGAASLLETGMSQGWDLARRARAAARGARARRSASSLVLNLPHVLRRLPVRGADPRAARALAPAPRLRARAGRPAPPHRRARAARADGRGRVRRPAVVGAHRGAAARDRVQGRGARRAARRDRDRHPADDALPPRARGRTRSRAANLGLGLALRLWRNAFPVRAGGTAILLHDFQRRFAAPTQTPYRALFSDPRTARDRDAVGEAERAATADPRALAELPRRPHGAPARAVPRLERLRRGREPARHASSSPAAATRRPHGSSASSRVGSVGAALGMARGIDAKRIGFLLSPPYFPLVVGGGEDDAP